MAEEKRPRRPARAPGAPVGASDDGTASATGPGADVTAARTADAAGGPGDAAAGPTEAVLVPDAAALRGAAAAVDAAPDEPAGVSTPIASAPIAPSRPRPPRSRAVAPTAGGIVPEPTAEVTRVAARMRRAAADRPVRPRQAAHLAVPLAPATPAAPARAAPAVEAPVASVPPPAASQPASPPQPAAAARSALEAPAAYPAPASLPSPTTWDAVVIGGGHNAMVAAAYMGRAGLRTLVLERRDRVGGAAATTEVAPGFRVPTLAHTVGRMRPSVVQDLDLTSHGLTLVTPEVRVFAPQRGRRAITLWADNARTVEGLRAWSPRDADRYVAFDRLVRSLARFLAEVGAVTPPDIRSPGLGDALAGLKLGRTFRGLGRHDARTVLRVLPMAIADFVAEAFETDALRAAIAWRGVQYCALGPGSAGTTAVLLSDSAGNDGGAAGQTVFAHGGPGELAWALEAAALAAGVEFRTGAEVTAITSRDGRATGVALASGEEIASSIVVSGVDPKRTLVGLVDPVALGPSLGWRASNIRTPGVVAKINLALRKLPRFSAAGADGDQLLSGRIVVAPGIDAMERAFDASKYGRISDQPILEATIPSIADPSLVTAPKPGGHVMSIVLQYAPYALREGAWDDARRNAVGDLALETLETVAPGIGKLVTARQVLTPVDLERDFGLTGGHPLHAEPGLDQFFLWRPLLGHARYRMPIENLYLAGSGAHPGGGLTGGPGQNAAREIVADWKKRKPKR